MIMVPGLIRTIPTFVIFARLGLINTYWPWLLWGLGSSPYFVFLFRQYFAGFPKELEDAAEIDGCNRWATFWRIFIPNAGPILAVCSIFSFQGNWGDFFTPVIFLKRRQATLAVAMADAYTDPMGNQMITLTLAGVVLFLIPAIIAFALGYRYIKEVAPTSGLKG
jgi:multiple sugar transport system permease protein